MGNSQCNKSEVIDPRDSGTPRELVIPDLSIELTDDFLECERKMLEHSGLTFDQFKIHNVVVDQEGNYIRTYEVGMSSTEKQKMVLIHGYGGSSIMFWKIIKPLAEQYHLIMVDILGMGASSRPEFTIEDPQEAVDYLVAWLETWRQKMGDMQGFVLAGHSFGGFVSGHYTCKYPQYVKKLLMLSPFGVPKRTFTDEEFEQLYANMQPAEGRRKPKRIFFSISKKVWEKRWSPFGILRKSGKCFVNYMMNRYVSNRIGGAIPMEELQDYKEYMKLTLLRKGSTEYALFVCFDHYFHSRVPLDDAGRLPDLPIPISFFYGDRDWMLNVGEHNVLERNPYKGTHSHMHTVHSSDHHLYFDNPEMFVELILQDLSNLSELEFPRTTQLTVEPTLEQFERPQHDSGVLQQQNA